VSNPLDKLNLRPFEKRLVVGVAVVVFIVLNAWFVWPHFKDWGEMKNRLDGARSQVQKYNKTIASARGLDKKVKEMQAEGTVVSAEDQANQFLLTVNNQASVSGVNITGISRQSTVTNGFFLEQLQTFSVSARDEQLVDFLYSLGSSDSIIRARGLSLRPNGSRQELNGNIDLVASYQKNPASKTTAKIP
jgi:Tfp pilus assembly protein PilO